jgi:CubicO group peptidase (beta-lactamase class C family)
VPAFVLVAAACSGSDGDDSTATASGDREPAAAQGGAGDEAREGGDEQSAAFPAQPEGVPFPTDEWPEGDWPSEVDRAAIDRAADTAFADGAAARVRALVIVQGGELVYEAYSPHPDDGRSAVMPAYSIAKSVTSALVGVAVDGGMIDIDAPAPVPEWSAPGDPRGGITTDDLLRMSSGLEWHEDYTDESDLTRLVAADDAAAYAAAKDLAHEPGTAFLYNTGGTVLVDRILADEVGTGQDFRDLAHTELLDKIGIGRMEMAFDDAGTWLGGLSADTNARNMAKFGLLFLRDGAWDGERILPEGWVEYCRTPSDTNPTYGAGWWLDPERPGVFYAVGVRGQTITVDPEHDLTVVQFATDSDLSLALSEAILDAFAAAD